MTDRSGVPRSDGIFNWAAGIPNHANRQAMFR